jgi:hypothetical protein
MYGTDSSSDFQALGGSITKRLQAILAKEATLGTAATAVTSSIAPVEGLKSHELVALVAIAENLESYDGTVTMFFIQKDMERAGFTRVANTLALASLA